MICIESILQMERVKIWCLVRTWGPTPLRKRHRLGIRNNAKRQIRSLQALLSQGGSGGRRADQEASSVRFRKSRLQGNSFFNFCMEL